MAMLLGKKVGMTQVYDESGALVPVTGSQNAYIQNVGADYFTLEEFILLGDPSLTTGGFE